MRRVCFIVSFVDLSGTAAMCPSFSVGSEAYADDLSLSNVQSYDEEVRPKADHFLVYLVVFSKINY